MVDVHQFENEKLPFTHLNFLKCRMTMYWIW